MLADDAAADNDNVILAPADRVLTKKTSLISFINLNQILMQMNFGVFFY